MRDLSNFRPLPRHPLQVGHSNSPTLVNHIMCWRWLKEIEQTPWIRKEAGKQVGEGRTSQDHQDVGPGSRGVAGWGQQGSAHEVIRLPFPSSSTYMDPDLIGCLRLSGTLGRACGSKAVLVVVNEGTQDICFSSPPRWHSTRSNLNDLLRDL